jgi:23S rRNA (cytidine2498-2'-O)-methyltransferase
MTCQETQNITAYLAAEDRVEDLVTELGDEAEIHDRLVLAPGPRRPAAWAANVWLNPVRLPVTSINEAARALRGIQRSWALYAFHLHRRAALIEGKLPRVQRGPLPFPAPHPKHPVGSWTLLDEHTLLASSQCSCPFPNGELVFEENRTDPPSRAYLKLWELFSRLGVWPGEGERCLDLGAAPGGWTWVLQQCGARVTAVDKAPLDPQVAGLPGVVCRSGSAFGVDPRTADRVDWLFSDVICYPARLLSLVERWIEHRPETNMVCTIKFQGPTDHSLIRDFAALPGSRLLHLHHNRHELTWFRLAPALMPCS